ncbi:GRIM-19 [Dacryopinax primogenitus]|uniref:NADH dehydrogenase [ubiquinone] 1 alpha subcomplex subunit 13 n=1 Tax=Dacryopinax primogenitus (strain DJM 731) TaxID=1858805 RepID=M5G820_DACPD|nr:GRIM-19 [Dacryopinax primogenitus]EJU06356.1 GRIM-19 [Dacryopinax primogenitus]
MSVPYRQDMPPTGGFEAIRYKRYLPYKGPSGAVIFGAFFLVSAYGLYRVGMGNREKRELLREKQWARIHLVPILMAEADRNLVRREYVALEREKELMKNVKGWQPGGKVYHSDKYIPPSIQI